MGTPDKKKVWQTVGCSFHGVLQGNGPVGQVETSPEMLLVYRAHLVMIAHKILAAYTRHKGVKKFPEVGTYSSNPPHLARA
jgi:hypothetical protein